MMIVGNSTTLIYLAKIGKKFLLKKIFGRVVIPEEVRKEIVDKGKEQKVPDAFIVDKNIKKGWVKVKKVKIFNKLEEFGIDKGEAEVISLAIKLKKEVLIDQTHARLAAKSFGLRPKGTIFVLLKALRLNLINYEEYLKSLEDLVKANFRMSDEVYLEAVRLGKEIKR